MGKVMCMCWDQRKDVENDENMTECGRRAVVLDREISNYGSISQRVAWRGKLKLWYNLFMVSIYGMIACNEDKENPATFKRKWGNKAESAIVDQYAYLGVKLFLKCSWDAHIAKEVGMGKAYAVGKMDVILTDSHLL